jgi:hypothetical protein
MLFIPDPNINGRTRFLILATDDYKAPSNAEEVHITVLEINDPPQFASRKGEVVYNGTSDTSYFLITGRVTDIDFLFGKRMLLTITANNATNMSVFADPPANSPCDVSDDGWTLTCQALNTEINSWFFNGFTFLPGADIESINFTLTISDLGNVDKWLIVNTTETWLFVNRTLAAGSLTGAVKAPTDNTALIVAPIAGLLAGVGIVALVWVFRGRKAAAEVDSYFERMALDMEGATNTSPLYKQAAKGGESALYKGSS